MCVPCLRTDTGNFSGNSQNMDSTLSGTIRFVTSAKMSLLYQCLQRMAKASKTCWRSPLVLQNDSSKTD